MKECGAVDSWEHFLDCYAAPDISKMQGQGKIQEIVNICKNAAEPNPARPQPSEVEYVAIERNMAAESEKEQQTQTH